MSHVVHFKMVGTGDGETAGEYMKPQCQGKQRLNHVTEEGNDFLVVLGVTTWR